MNDHSRNRGRNRAWLFGDDQAAPPAASQPESLQAMLEQTADEAGEPYHGLLDRTKDRRKNSAPRVPRISNWELLRNQVKASGKCRPKSNPWIEMPLVVQQRRRAMLIDV